MIFVPLVSIVHLLLVAVERFVKIVYPLHYHMIATRSRAVILIIFTWLFPFSPSSVLLVLRSLLFLKMKKCAILSNKYFINILNNLITEGIELRCI
ncbi:putative trace amine-associated receptor 3 [Mytilus trossulus]|uniref:putative trace amine-associated receptor 3 n=1 Tax=Mytilus trossulus TaxID=6551 RepID=UPI0030048115